MKLKYLPDHSNNNDNSNNNNNNNNNNNINMDAETDRFLSLVLRLVAMEIMLNLDPDHPPQVSTH